MKDSHENPSERVAQRLQSIDLLRGLAMLAVLFVHIPHDAPGGWRENGWFFPSLLMDFGYLGVPLFVLISGFCIHRRAAIARRRTGEWTVSWVEFWKRRFWRLYPPYLVAIAVSLLAGTLLHSRTPDLTKSLTWDLSTHLFMIHNLTAEYSGGLGNGAFWSLGMEEQLYAFYFLLLIMFRRRTPVIFCVAMVTIFWRLLLPYMTSFRIGVEPLMLGNWGQWPFSYWLHWTLGALAVDRYYQNRTLPNWTLSFSFALLFLGSGGLCNARSFDLLASVRGGRQVIDSLAPSMLMTIHLLGEVLVAVGFFCLLNWTISREETRVLKNPLSRAIIALGRISYSVYLAHIPVIYSASAHVNIGNTGFDWILRAVFFSALSILGGGLFYVLIERWFIEGRPPRFRSLRRMIRFLIRG